MIDEFEDEDLGPSDEDMQREAIDSAQGGVLQQMQHEMHEMQETQQHEQYEEFYDNIADLIVAEPTVEQELVNNLLDLIEEDKEAQSEADRLYAEGIRRTGMSKDAPGGADFAGASKAVHPIMAELAIDCSSRIIKELLCQQDIVRINVEGRMTPERWKRSKRKQKLLNQQMRDPEYGFEDSFESLTTQAPLNGDQYLKCYYDEDLGHAKFMFVPSDQICIQATASSFASAARKTHLLKLTLDQYEAKVKSGAYRDLEIDIDSNSSSVADQTEPEQQTEKIAGVQPDETAEEGYRLVYECHTLVKWGEFGGEGLDDQARQDRASPYIVTIDVEARKLLAVHRNWRYDDKNHKARRHFVQAKYLPWRGPKGIGLIHLVGSLSGALTGTIRALLDSAHIQNSPTALKLRFAQASSQSMQINIGEINEIQADGQVTDIRQLVTPLPFSGPSATLVQLLGDLDKLARGVVRTMIDDNPEDGGPNAPVGTTLSRVEQGLMVFSSIFRRFHKVVAEAADILSELNYLHLEDKELTKEDEEDDIATRDDFNVSDDITPVADPNTFTTQQRLSQMQGVLQLAVQAPDLYDIQAIHRRILELMKVDGIKEIMPDRNDQKDENPVTENVKMSMGQVAFALPDQDHEAHLKVHLDYMMNPMFGMNPIFTGQLIQPMIDHLKQHMTLGYAQLMLHQVNQYLPVPLEDLMEDDTQLMEKVSMLLASQSEDALNKAAEVMAPYAQQLQQLIQMYQQMMAAMPQPMDPVQAQLQIAQQTNEANLKAVETNSAVQLQEQNRKAQKDIIDAQTADKKLAIEDEKNKLKAVDLQQKAQQLEEERMQKQAIEQAKLEQEANLANQDMEIKTAINEADNKTAIHITELNIEAGKQSNLSTGGGIDPGN